MTRIFINEIVDFYPYRRAMVDGYSFCCRLNSEEITELSKRLEKQGYSFDNHICWRTDEGTCFMYTDNQLYIGRRLSVERW